MVDNYANVTEMPGRRISHEQLQRMTTRYIFAAEHCKDKDVLEVACGVGQGLGILAKNAKKIIAGDYSECLVLQAKKHYGDRIDIRQFDAQSIPFNDKSIDVVIFYEAIYYLKQPEMFVTEAKRVLRENGKVIICLANKDWSGFARSPLSHSYFSVPELFRLLDSRGFQTELYGDCPVSDGSISGSIISAIRSAAVKLNLIPNDMKSKEILKRIFFGKLIDMPAELEANIINYVRPKKIASDKICNWYKVIFAVGTLKNKV